MNLKDPILPITPIALVFTTFRGKTSSIGTSDIGKIGSLRIMEHSEGGVRNVVKRALWVQVIQVKLGP